MRKDRTEFGNRSNVYRITEAHDLAIRQGILEGRLDLDNFQDLQLVLNWQLSKTFMQRGVKERVHLLWSKFVLYHYDVEGPLKGLPCFELVRDFDKTCPLTLSNPTVKNQNVRLIYVHNPKDPLSLYTLMQKYRSMCSPTQACFYCYEKDNNKIIAEHSCGKHRYLSNLLSPIGEKEVAKFGQEIARRCGLPDWEKCTNHGWRGLGISRLANSKDVSLSEAMGAARHTTATVHQSYISVGDVSEVNRIKAMSDVPF